jgi:glycosyltransferase involved in cell wall biosynthesis
VPHLSTEHGDIHLATGEIGRKEIIKTKTISLFSDRVIFVSKFTRDKFRMVSKIDGRKSVIVYNGINIEEYKEPTDIERKKREIGIKKDESIIGNVASLFPVKGQIYFLAAAKEVIKEFPKVKFLIIGEGWIEDKLKEEADKLGITSHVEFLGFRNDVKELLNIMDMFVLPSLSEGLPFSLLEAMACRIPVIATKVGGIPEIIDDGMNGFLVPPADPEALAEKIKCLLEDPIGADRLAQRGYEKIELFDIQSMLKAYEEIYSGLIKR